MFYIFILLIMETPSEFNQKTKKVDSSCIETSKRLCDELKPWTLYSFEPEQFVAMEKVEELWEILAVEEWENLVKLRNKLLTNSQIAEIVIPHIYVKYPWVAAGAVSYALWLLMWKEARNEKTTKVISALWKAPKNVVRLKEIAKSWISARIEKYWEDEVFRQRSVWWKKSVELQWKKAFSEEEKEFVIIFSEDENYKDELWRIKFGVIANEINNMFWNWNNVRNSKAIYDCYRRYWHKNGS